MLLWSARAPCLHGRLSSNVRRQMNVFGASRRRGAQRSTAMNTVRALGCTAQTKVRTNCASVNSPKTEIRRAKLAVRVCHLPSTAPAARPLASSDPRWFAGGFGSGSRGLPVLRRSAHLGCLQCCSLEPELVSLCSGAAPGFSEEGVAPSWRRCQHLFWYEPIQAFLHHAA
jgi:hypothetical protein